MLVAGDSGRKDTSPRTTTVATGLRTRPTKVITLRFEMTAPGGRITR